MPQNDFIIFNLKVNCARNKNERMFCSIQQKHKNLHFYFPSESDIHLTPSFIFLFAFGDYNQPWSLLT